MTDGRTYDVRHPDLLIVLRSRAIVGVGGDQVPDRDEDVALLHVVRIEPLPAAA